MYFVVCIRLHSFSMKTPGTWRRSLRWIWRDCDLANTFGTQTVTMLMVHSHLSAQSFVLFDIAIWSTTNFLSQCRQVTSSKQWGCHIQFWYCVLRVIVLLKRCTLERSILWWTTWASCSKSNWCWFCSVLTFLHSLIIVSWFCGTC